MNTFSKIKARIEQAARGTNGCIEIWRSKTNPYPRVCIDSREIKSHRAAYEAFFGPIPAGLLVCHKCDNTRCSCGTMISEDQNRKALSRLLKGRKKNTAPVVPQIATAPTLALTPAEQYRDKFLSVLRSKPGLNPHCLLPPAYPNPRNKTRSRPFNLDEFLGFGLFLKTLEEAH